ncbi:MAG: hypothetical protein JWQ69_1335 [Pseudomonas sp.]|nr:hypothetical protein [Pseudomonas sp.]
MNNFPSATLLAGALLSVTAFNTQANPFAYQDKPFDQHYWVTTHNSYEPIHQNIKKMPQQLKDGVRGFMLDLYPPGNNDPAEHIRVCHKSLCYGPFSNHIKNEFLPFLKANPKEVVTIFLETYVSRDQLQTFFDTLPELADYSFNPANFADDTWPTLGQMAEKNNRLILMTDRNNVSGNYTVNGKTITVLYDQDWIVQNHWETLGLTRFTHDWSCPTRWKHLPLNTKTVDWSTGKTWNRLFLMNQFHPGFSDPVDSADNDNNLTSLVRRENNCGAKPHFIGINNYRSGDTASYARALTEGSIYFYERNNADTSVNAADVVCVLPRGPHTLGLPSQGCENDEARSLSLSGIAKGTRINLYDNPRGSREDDHATIDVKRDIGIDEKVVVGSFELNRNNNDYRIVYSRNNGLDGKVSRIEVTTTPIDFSDASIAFYEGNNARQNLDCAVPFNRAHNIQMRSNSFGCSNDEIRSARIIKAKAGSSFFLTGSPQGGYSQGVTKVTVLRDINDPVVVGSFNRSYNDGTVSVENSRGSIDGKISHAAIWGSQ